MTVADNISYGLKIKRGKGRIQERVEELLKLIEGLGEGY
jgi:ABC-type sulfate/molybdate transport systems ATPase subunit